MGLFRKSSGIGNENAQSPVFSGAYAQKKKISPHRRFAPVSRPPDPPADPSASPTIPNAETAGTPVDTMIGHRVRCRRWTGAADGPAGVQQAARRGADGPSGGPDPPRGGSGIDASSIWGLGSVQQIFDPLLSLLIPKGNLRVSFKSLALGSIQGSLVYATRGPLQSPRVSPRGPKAPTGMCPAQASNPALSQSPDPQGCLGCGQHLRVS